MLVQCNLDTGDIGSEYVGEGYCENCGHSIGRMTNDEIAAITRGSQSLLCFDCEDIGIPKYKKFSRSFVSKLKKQLGVTDVVKPMQWSLWVDETHGLIASWTKDHGWRVWRQDRVEGKWLLCLVRVRPTVMSKILINGKFEIRERLK